MECSDHSQIKFYTSGIWDPFCSLGRMFLSHCCLEIRVPDHTNALFGSETLLLIKEKKEMG